jgi:predicted metalloprotease with PDZ domain
MDRFNKLSGTAKAACFVALAVAFTGALVLLAVEKAAAEMAEHGFLGVSAQRLTDDEREKLGVAYGVQVVAVEKESAAAKAGIQQDDVILSVNGEKVRDPLALSDIVRELAPGSAAKIGLWRGGKALDVTATLGKYERPERPAWHGAPFTKILRSGAYLGIRLLDMPPDLAAYFGVKAGEGVLVTGVEKETPAAKASVKAGDVIVQVGEKIVKESDDIHEALAGLKKGDSVVLTVVRHGKREAIKVEPDFNRRERVLRFFGGGKDIEIEHLALPEMDIEVPDIDVEVPCPPEPPAVDAIVRKIDGKLDRVRIKIDRRLKRIGENFWI